MGLFSPPFPVVHDQLLCLAHIEGEVVVLAQNCQVSDLLLISCLIVVGDQAYRRCVVSKLNDAVGVMLGHAVVGEQGVQEGTKHALLRDSRVKDKRGKCVVAYPYPLWEHSCDLVLLSLPISLFQLTVVMERIMAFSLASPLAKFLNGLEILLSKAQVSPAAALPFQAWS